jgi:RimJ/RimL family protein N-acetyltransferase
MSSALGLTEAYAEGWDQRLRSRLDEPGDTIRNVTLSETMWGVDWSAHLPAKLTDDGVVMDASSYDEASPFIGSKFAAMFEEDLASSPFMHGKATDAKGRYYRLCADFFAFRHRGSIVGVLVCNPIDWSTYYIRFCAFLPEYQGRQLLQRFFPEFFRILKLAGVERIETETSPSNLAVMHIMNRFRFNNIGTILSERWGALVRFAKFLDDESEDVFLRQFCTGIRYQARPTKP